MNNMRLLILAMIGLLQSNLFAHAENWDRFRGPNGAGQSDATGIPTEWGKENFLWRRELPGVGHSSPVVWGKIVFVTSGDRQTGEQIVQAFDALSGEPLWERRFDGSTYSMHAHNCYASSTPAADADHLYFMWLAEGGIKLVALTHHGDEVWRRDVGPFQEEHGFGKSPVVIGDLVYVANDNEAESQVLAFERSTGEVRWRKERPSGTTAFATPFVFEPGAKQKLLVTASTAAGVTAFDLDTGDVAWQGLEDDLPLRCLASPVSSEKLILVMCGAGGNGKHLIAAKPQASGEGRRLQEVYRLRESIPNVPTPVVAGDLLFLWHDRGVVSCFDASTGDLHWRKRVGGDYHSSPIRIGDRIFGVSSEGEVVVLAADEEFKLLARNPLGEPTRATPAVAHGRLYLRTEESLICIGE